MLRSRDRIDKNALGLCDFFILRLFDNYKIADFLSCFLKLNQ